MVFKVQRSIWTGEACPQVLVYDRAHRHEYMGPLTHEMAHFMGEELKMFFNGHIEGTEIVLDGVATWRNW
jgi:hypothetical protein